MGYNRVISASVFLGFMLQAVLARSPPYIRCDSGRYAPCRCSRDNLWARNVDVLTCDSIGTKTVIEVLQRIKSKSPNNRISLTIIDNEVTALPNKYLGDVQVDHLMLKAPKLQNVDENAFEGQESQLETVTFDGCGLSSVPVKSLNKLSNLKYLNFINSKAKLNSLDKNTFSGLTNAAKVQQLRLENNGIESMESGALGAFKDIVYLYLGKNELSYVNEDSLPPQKLELLELDGNKFSQVPQNLISKVNRGGSINLRNNKIVNVPSATIAKSLSEGVHVNVYANNLNCDCAYKQIPVYELDHPYQGKVHGECATPGNMKGKHIRELKVSDFPDC